MPSKLKSIILTHDGTGRARWIRELVEMMDDVNSLDGSAQIEGMKELQTERGQTVNFLGAGKYKIVATNEILTAEDPPQD